LQFARKPHNASPELSDGTAVPVICDRCQGSGQVPDEQPVIDTPAKAKPAPAQQVAATSPQK
jgi:hypothetical protein